MNALDYILANYQWEKYQNSLAERAVLRALVHTLNKEELLILQKKLKRGFSKWSVGKGLYEEATKIWSKIQPQKNESIYALLKAFTDKQSGMVAEARVKLRDRFDRQSFLVQRKILKAMLSSSKQDRVWTYKKLCYAWDVFFFEDVKNLWEQYHEKECVAVVIKHFPIEYVYENLYLIQPQCNYTNLCIKLIHHPKFLIDKELLKDDFIFSGYPEVEYLYILAKSRSKVETGFATKTLFRQMAEFINTHNAPPKYLHRSYNFGQQIEEKSISTMHFDFVSSIIWCMGELGLAEELIAFEEWDNMVKISFFGCEELQYMWHIYFSEEEEKELWDLYRMTIIECLPSAYQQLVHVFLQKPITPTKEDFIKKNPEIGTLIDKLKLEVV